MQTPSFNEHLISQIPALQLLMKMGYQYLSPSETYEQRRHKTSHVILEDILEQQLRKINTIEFRGEQYPFSNKNIAAAIQAIKNISLKEGLGQTAEKAYNLLTLGKSFEETIKHDTKSYTLQYIDWEHPLNNAFHVTAEFTVQRPGSIKTYRSDIVLFVNGIPFCIIVTKSPAIQNANYEKPVDMAINQHLRNQEHDAIPHLYIYSHILVSLCTNDAKYATTGTPKEWWACWIEEHDDAKALKHIVNTPLSKSQKEQLFDEQFHEAPEYFNKSEEPHATITNQDQLLYYICRPERLMELTWKFIVFNAGTKKIARYQQYFTVKNTTARAKTFKEGRRKGGVIWHTQGSGKSITMIMMARSLALDPEIENPVIVIVTDRTGLDDQISKTFKHCDKQVKQARTGKELIRLINSKSTNIITTVINKFETAVKRGTECNPSHNIFILVDESHRSHYEESNINMQRMFPNACYIGFTGTPIKKKYKNTVQKFGGIIPMPYTIDRAMEDKAVVPLLYEGRHTIQDVDQSSIDTYFNMVSEPYPEYQRADMKKKFSRADRLNITDRKIYRIAWDISLQFEKSWQNTGFKGQLAVPSKVAALKYKQYLDDIGKVTTEILISGPGLREGNEQYPKPNEQVVQFWNQMMKRFSNEKTYNREIIRQFKHEPHPEIIIVVDKLLTGFDEPHNIVLFITRSLKEHVLLQAIARVNRVCEGKDYGFIIDYYGVLSDLDKAVNMYSSLSEYDEEDLRGTLLSMHEEMGKLPGYHSHLWDIFKSIENENDTELYERFLENKATRNDFYERLSLYARTLRIALASFEFFKTHSSQQINTYKNDLTFFIKLRTSVKARYSDETDYKQYEGQIQKLVDTHVRPHEFVHLTDQVNIFDKEKFAREIEKVNGTAAKADRIASRTVKAIAEKTDEDPAFYRKFSNMIKETIDEWKQKRISDLQYLQKVTHAMKSVQNHSGDDSPEILGQNMHAKAFYGIVLDILHNKLPYGTRKEISAKTGLAIDEIIGKHCVVDWQNKKDVINLMSQEIEDLLFNVKSRHNLDVGWNEIDAIIEQIMNTAKKRYL
jgi:type I restriction enzyme R subunit